MRRHRHGRTWWAYHRIWWWRRCILRLITWCWAMWMMLRWHMHWTTLGNVRRRWYLLLLRRRWLRWWRTHWSSLRCLRRWHWGRLRGWASHCYFANILHRLTSLSYKLIHSHIPQTQLSSSKRVTTTVLVLLSRHNVPDKTFNICGTIKNSFEKISH